MSAVKPTGQDVLSSKAQLLVCPTNALGVMGAGLAKTFRDKVPGLYPEYRRHCHANDVHEMVPFVFEAKSGKTIYCLHTKRYWQENSTLKIVQRGLHKLREYCNLHDVESIAMPALGCGKGNLEWKDVEPLLLQFAKDVKADVEIYHPDGILTS